MVEKLLLRLAAVGVIFLGAFVCIRARTVSAKISSFYSNYPLVRYAGKEQLKSRPVYIRIIGVVIALVGVLCLVSI